MTKTNLIGIGVTTRNRPNELRVTLAHILGSIQGFPPGVFNVVVVDDASTDPVDTVAEYGVEFHHFERNVGVARAKNKCLELLADAEHIFLFDDDTYPLVDGWWRPYVASPEPHLMRQFLDLSGPKKLRDLIELYRDDRHVAYSGPRGVMLYLHRSAIDRVGGFDPVFSPWGYEHGDLSNRIHAAGLTTHRYADVTGSDQLVYSMDEHVAVERSVPRPERLAAVARNASIHDRRRDNHDTRFVPYREPVGRNVVLTPFFTSGVDPQRPDAAPLGWEAVDALVDSLAGVELVILTDDPETGSDHLLDRERLARCTLTDNPLNTNVYFERWIAAYQWLRANEDVAYAVMVDATDVVMQHEPWSMMLPGKLYIGHEPTTVGCRWMRQNHPSSVLQRFMVRNADKVLINPGVVGGDRETLMAFIHALIETYFDLTARVHIKGDKGVGIGDMGVVNLVAHTRFQDHIEYGPDWVTKFKAYETENTRAAWRHK